MRETSVPGVVAWKSGDYYSICDRCGFKFFRSEMRKTWDNLIVCQKDYEERQPQDFVKSVPDQIAVYDTRTEGEDQFITEPVTQEDL